MQFLWRIGCTFVVGASCWSAAIAQEIPPPPKAANPAPSEMPSANLLDFFSAKTPYEFWLTCIILAAGLVFTGIAVRFLSRVSRRDLDSGARAMTVFFVIIATMVLITAGYNNEQIAPAFGLFGTIVGYILGRSQNAKPPTGEQPPASEPGEPSPAPISGAEPPTQSAPQTDPDSVSNAGPSEEVERV